MTRRYYHDEVGAGTPASFDLPIQAAVLEVKLRYVESGNARRRTLATRYDQLFREAGRLQTKYDRGHKPGYSETISTVNKSPDTNPVTNPNTNPGGPSFPASSEGVGCLPIPAANTPTDSITSTKNGIVLPYTDPRATHIFHQYVIRAPRRDALRQYLTDRQIGSEIYYPLPLHLQTSLTHLGYKQGDFPESERAAAEVLALPIYPELREDEQQTVVQAIRTFYA